MTKQFVNPKAP